MHHSADREGLGSGFRIITIIWSLMFSTLGIYVAICLVAGDELKAEMGPGLPLAQLKYILLSVSLVTFGLIRFFRNAMLKANPRKTDIPLPRGLSEAGRSALSRYMSAVIVSAALAESVAIYGLLLFMLGEGFDTFYLFTAISAAAMLYYRPRRDELDSLVTGQRPQGQRIGQTA